MEIIAFILSIFRPDWRLSIFSRKKIAIGGYDIISFYSEKKPKVGKPWICITYQNVNWWFTSKANKKKFIESPEKYIPVFGGFCSWGMAQGYKAKTSPGKAWTLLNGKLYFNYDVSYQKLWLEKTEQNIEIGQKNWQMLSKIKAKRL